MPHPWTKSLIPPETDIREAIRVMTKSALQVGLVVDAERHLLGVLTDGDIRRAILNNVELTRPVSEIMERRFTFARANDTKESVLSLMRTRDLRQVPILDEEGRIIDLKVVMNFFEHETRDNWVVLMAGGLGSRLAPLTEACPKPLLKVGGRPILETIMQGFMDHGFRKFFISVNYRAEMIEQYFGDGSRWGVEIRYLRETCRLGTAGSLGLFPERPTDTFLVMNGDLLTRIDFGQMLATHKQSGAAATVGIREYDIQVPFGVVNVDGTRLVGLEEKPHHKFFVNAGVYALEPAALDLIQAGTCTDMPEVLQRLLDQGDPVSTFPIHEYWMDIGRIGDYERANGEFHLHFDD